jgi:hypothetical protein
VSDGTARKEAAEGAAGLSVRARRGVHLQPRGQGVEQRHHQAEEEALMDANGWWLLAAIGLALWLANLPAGAVGVG